MVAPERTRRASGFTKASRGTGCFEPNLDIRDLLTASQFPYLKPDVCANLVFAMHKSC